MTMMVCYVPLFRNGYRSMKYRHLSPNLTEIRLNDDDEARNIGDYSTSRPYIYSMYSDSLLTPCSSHLLDMANTTTATVPSPFNQECVLSFFSPASAL